MGQKNLGGSNLQDQNREKDEKLKVRQIFIPTDIVEKPHSTNRYANGFTEQNKISGPGSRRVVSKKKINSVEELVEYVKNSHVNVKRKIIFGSLIASICVLIGFVACLLVLNDLNQVKQIEIDKTTVASYYDSESTFDLSSISMFVKLKSGQVSKKNLSESMLSRQDLNKLKTIGRHQITVNYQNKQAVFFISIEKMYDVTFIIEGDVVHKYRVVSGSALKQQDIPDLPEREGYYATWSVSSSELNHITSDIYVEGIYISRITNISFPDQIDKYGNQIYQILNQSGTYATVGESFEFTIKLSAGYTQCRQYLVVRDWGNTLAGRLNDDGSITYTIPDVGRFGVRIGFENVAINRYTVIFKNFNGTNILKTSIIEYNHQLSEIAPNEITDNPNDNAYYYFEFYGWGITNNTENDFYDLDNNLIYDDAKITSDLTVFARYRREDQIYNVTFYDRTLNDNNNEILSLEVTYNQAICYTGTQPEIRTAERLYTFKQWDVEAGVLARDPILEYNATFSIGDYYTDETVRAGNIKLNLVYYDLDGRCVLRFYLDDYEARAYVINTGITYHETFYADTAKTDILRQTTFNTLEYTYRDVTWYHDLNGNQVLDDEEKQQNNQISLDYKQKREDQIFSNLQFVADFTNRKFDREYTVNFIDEDDQPIGSLTLVYNDSTALNETVIKGNQIVSAPKDISRAFKEWQYNDAEFSWANLTEEDILSGIITLKVKYADAGSRTYHVNYTYFSSNDDFATMANAEATSEDLKYGSQLLEGDAVKYTLISAFYSLNEQGGWINSGSENLFTWEDLTEEDILSGTINLTANYTEIMRIYDVYVRYAGSADDLNDRFVSVGQNARLVRIGERQYGTTYINPSDNHAGWSPLIYPFAVKDSYYTYSFKTWQNNKGSTKTMDYSTLERYIDPITYEETRVMVFNAEYTRSVRQYTFNFGYISGANNQFVGSSIGGQTWSLNYLTNVPDAVVNHEAVTSWWLYPNMPDSEMDKVYFNAGVDGYNIIFFDLNSYGRVVLPNNCNLILPENNLVESGTGFTFKFSTGDKSIKIIISDLVTGSEDIRYVDANSSEVEITLISVMSNKYIQFLEID